MTITAQDRIFPRATRQMKADIVMILSTSGSISFPPLQFAHEIPVLCEIRNARPESQTDGKQNQSEPQQVQRCQGRWFEHIPELLDDCDHDQAIEDRDNLPY